MKRVLNFINFERLEFPLFLLIFLYVPNFYFLDWPIYIQYFKQLVFLFLISIICLLRTFSLFGKKQKFKLGIFDLILAAFLLAYAVSALLSTDLQISIFGVEGGRQEGLIFFLGIVLLFYLAQHYLKTYKRLLSFCLTTAFGLFISFLIEVFRYGLNFNHFTNIRIIGADHQPIYYGMYLLAGTIISLGLFSSAKNWGRLILGLFIAFLILLILANGTRSVWLAMAISLTTVLMLDLKSSGSVVKKVWGSFQGKILLLVITAAFLLLAFVWQRPLERLNSAFASSQKDPSLTIRFLEWRGAWKVFKNNLIWGQGPGSISYNYPGERELALNSLKGGDEELVLVRNVYLNYLANLGLLPSLLVFALFFAIFISAVTFLQKVEDRKLIWVIFWAWLSLLLAHLFYHYTITSAIFFWALSGVLVYWTKGNFPLTAFTIPKNTASFLLAIGGAGAALALIFFITVFYTEALFIKAVRQGDVLPKIKALEQVAGLTPWDAGKLRVLAMWEVDNQKSLKYMEKAHSLSPADLNITHDLGVLYFKTYLQTQKKEYLRSSGKYFQKVYEKYPSRALSLDSLGEYYLAEGDLEEAEKYFKQALVSNSNYVYGYYHLGEVFKQKGQFKEAKNYYLQSLKYWDNLPFVEEKIKEIQSLEEQN